MGQVSKWKVEKQPDWLITAIRKTISALPGGYVEASEWLGITQHALFNRLRSDGDQIFPLGWALVLQKAANTTFITDAIAHASYGVFIPHGEIQPPDNADINEKLMESIEWIGRHSTFLREAIADGVIDKRERAHIESCSYHVMKKWQEHISLRFRVFCEAQKR